MNRSESISNLAAALAKSQLEMKNPTFDSNNPFFKSKYASLAAVRNAVLPVLAANGLSVIQEVTHEAGVSRCRSILMHASGQWIECEPFSVPVSKADAQGACAGATYARRASLQALACVVGDSDDDAESVVDHEPKKFEPKYQKAHKDPVSSAPNEEIPTDSGPKPSAVAYMNYLSACSTTSQVEATGKEIARDAAHFTEEEKGKLREAVVVARARVKDRPAVGSPRTVNGRTQAEWIGMPEASRELNGEISMKAIEQLQAYGRSNGVSENVRLLRWLADTHCALPTAKSGEVGELWQVGWAWYAAVRGKIDAHAGARA